MMIAKPIFKKDLKLTLTLLLTLSFFPAESMAKQLYRYKNLQGNIVLGQSIPPEFVSNGYDIINEQGRLVRIVPAALTLEQILERDKQRELEKQQALAKQKQDIIDHELKQLYSHPNDAVRILKRKIQDIHDVIQVKNNNIDSAQIQILDNEAIAAEQQRMGKPIPQEVITKIDQLKKSIAHSKDDISELKDELRKVFYEFDIKIKRLEKITHHTASDYPVLLESLK